MSDEDEDVYGRGDGTTTEQDHKEVKDAVERMGHINAFCKEINALASGAWRGDRADLLLQLRDIRKLNEQIVEITKEWM